jgi:hypothetical protein
VICITVKGLGLESQSASSYEWGLRLAPVPINIKDQRPKGDMLDTAHNLLFQEAILPAGDAAGRAYFLQRVPSQRKIDAFLKGRNGAHPSPRFAEFFEFHIAVFVAEVPDPDGTRVVVAGVTNVNQKQFEQVAAVIGRGTARWNRAEFKRTLESILGISIQDLAGQGR